MKNQKNLHSLPGGSDSRMPWQFVWSIIAVCLLPAIFSLIGVDFASHSQAPAQDWALNAASNERIDAYFHQLSGAFNHSLLEWSSFCVAAFVVLLALSHYRVTGNALTPVIGMAYLLFAAMDAIHILIADQVIKVAAEHQNIIPFTWTISRSLSAVIIIAGIAVLLYRKSDAMVKLDFRFLLRGWMLFAAAVLVMTYFTLTATSLPQTVFPHAILSRPYDIFPLLVYLFAGMYVFPRLYRRYPGVFAHSLIISTIPMVVAHLHMAFGSSELYDSHFNIAHFTKTLAYLVPLLGLVWEYLHLQDKLQREVAQRIQSDAALQKDISTLEQLHHISSDASLDLNERIREVLKLGKAALHFSTGIVTRMKHGKLTIVCTENSSRLVNVDTSSMYSYCRNTFRSKALSVFNNIPQSPLSIRGVPVSQGWQAFNSYVGAPLIVNNEAYGTLCFIDKHTHQPFSQNELTLIKLLAQWLSGELSRDQADKTLRRFKQTVDRTQDCVFMFHPDSLKFFYVNEGACKQIDYSEEELLRMTPFDINPGFDEARFRDMIRPMLSGETSVMTLETIHQRKAGETLPVEISLQYIKPPGEQARFVAFVRDMTERKANERMKDEFVATVSHELRTPLTSIRGSLGLLVGGASGEIPELVRSLVHIAHKNTDRLLLLINDILDINKIESGNMPFHFGSMEMEHFLRNAVESNTGYAEQQHVTFQILPSSEKFMVYGDEDRLMQVMSNLLSNAAKFSPAGSNIEVAASRLGNTLRISVSDQGNGIPQTFQHTIFNKFTQQDSSDTRKAGGTGLGLSIAKAIIEKHNGQIGFVSKIDVGSVFYFELPLLPDNNREWELPGVAPDLEPGPYTVLIVEDDPDVAARSQFKLAQAGFNSDIALSAAETLRQLDEKRYAAMTLNLMLPDQDSIVLYHEIRAMPATRHLPILMVCTFSRQAQLHANSHNFDVVEWLNKPIDEKKLIQDVQRALNPTRGERPHLLYVETDPALHQRLDNLLGTTLQISHATTLREAKALLASNHYQLLLLEPTLPDGYGLELLDDNFRGDNPAQVMMFCHQAANNYLARRVRSVLLKSRTSPQQLLSAFQNTLAVH